MELATEKEVLKVKAEIGRASPLDKGDPSG